MSDYIENARSNLSDWSKNIDAETFNKQLVESLSREDALDKKLWDVRVLSSGGISYYYPEQTPTNDLKKRYRVSCTYKDEHTKLLKYKVRTATDEVFSVAAKTQSEAQAVVNELFGFGHYKVSQQMV